VSNEARRKAKCEEMAEISSGRMAKEKPKTWRKWRKKMKKRERLKKMKK